MVNLVFDACQIIGPTMGCNDSSLESSFDTVWLLAVVSGSKTNGFSMVTLVCLVFSNGCKLLVPSLKSGFNTAWLLAVVH